MKIQKVVIRYTKIEGCGSNSCEIFFALNILVYALLSLKIKLHSLHTKWVVKTVQKVKSPSHGNTKDTPPLRNQNFLATQNVY